jgi:lipopolysaccharide/colanic/teichoic acid biosynthesis glycosyltransferase
MYDPRYARRFDVRPGITGLWQISGRNRLTAKQALDLDVEYVDRRSFRLDLAILCRTIPAVLSRDGAG